ncbi:uncharacterized protein LOC126899248 isoform X13 [Daktulosphaira vitifoliae]|uniref:uncharacterized protein LOC126899248 isoform X9 n=1 Tax=Daktulosphaira vitifoliae TaxID=58002 RepID=UPI0021AA1C9E|nr:uncharacterized protein LOC126899248 isoform X9 [Daktulosphaira vitifoliae]XP_050529941.1 uncharacterized protein LOC126899248 isoform X10 [Daktulosphaira vitifoliae]XP_050529951.1 uncharacterized protein LOC126899248 isoform X11 [Daktulosphaira vitifoliae]XP_050529959.1 uncharacterized protein LOC126899248 isoform X12 [Daktulosphaira vitifoliae]XP_050529968.1 uncharacterized protein LOC126899248 isoform X13 [Daktulosphaira vitifoliae]
MRLLHIHFLFFCFYFIKPSVSTISDHLWKKIGKLIDLTNEKLEKVTKESFYKKFNRHIKEASDRSLEETFVRYDLSSISRLDNADGKLKIYISDENFIYYYITGKHIVNQNYNYINDNNIFIDNVNEDCNDIDEEFFNKAVKKRNDMMIKLLIGYFYIINDNLLHKNENEISKINKLIKTLEDNSIFDELNVGYDFKNGDDVTSSILNIYDS